MSHVPINDDGVPTLRPVDALPDGPSGDVLPADQVDQWREKGFALVNGILPAELINEVRAAALRVYPDGDGPMRDDFGSGGAMCFPSVDDDLLVVNEVPLHMRMLRAVHQLLGTDQYGIRLTQCDLWGKRGTADSVFTMYCNSNQRMHCDYPNHTLVVPPPWERPEVVSIIVYYDSSAAVGGETRVVPREGPTDPAYHSADADSGFGSGFGSNPLLLTPGARGDMLWVNDRAHAEAYLEESFPDVHRFRKEQLYPRECRVGFEVGSVLFYRHDIWHRGAPLLPGATRRTQNIVYKRAECDWVGNWGNGPARRMYERNQAVEKIIARSNNVQRSILGFPSPQSAYWTADTLAAVRARYGPLPGGFQHAEPIETALAARVEPSREGSRGV